MIKLNLSDFTQTLLQASIFVETDKISIVSLINSLLSKWTGLFDDEPKLFPEFEGVSADFPQIILTSKSQVWLFEVFKSRFNISWRKIKEDTASISRDEFFSIAHRHFAELLDTFSLRVVRLGVISHLYFKGNILPSFLLEHLCLEKWNDLYKDALRNFEAHFHIRTTLDDRFSVNCWNRLKSGVVKIEKDVAQIQLIQDINTLSEDVDKANYNSEDLIRYFSHVNKSLSDSFNSFFGDKL